jgi:cysteine synthase
VAFYNNILDTIGNTPLVRLNKLAPNGVNVFVKVESFNPMGSIKDRMARAVIEQAKASLLEMNETLRQSLAIRHPVADHALE